MKLLFVGVVIALLAESSPADACSGPECVKERLLLAAGVTVPKNVAFALRVGANPDVALRDGAGAVVPTTVVPLAASFGLGWPFSATLVPSAPLPEGRYSLELSTTCSYNDVTTRDSRPFIVGPARALPTDVGTLHIITRPQGKLRIDGGPACIVQIDAVQVGVELVPSASFAPFQSSAVLSVWVDGNPWQGVVLDTETYLHAPETFDPFIVYATCDRFARAPSPGKHAVEVRATIPGTSAVLTTPPVEVDLSCPAPEALPVEATASPSFSGCSTSPRRSPALLWSVVLAGCALLLVGRTRRRTHRERPSSR